VVLRVTARPGRDCTVVEVHGDLDMATSPQLKESLQRVIDSGDRQVVVDLAGVGFMDSSALGALVTVFKALRGLGGQLRLAEPQRVVRDVLSITTVDRAIGVYDSVEAAEADVPSTGDATAG
jgi:anti-sigma B factor antagonist